MIALVNENENVIKSMAATDTTKYPEYLTSSGGGNNASSIFLAGRSLFSASLVADAQTIVGNIKFEYGLLPMPKWDEKQENYQTALQRSCYALIPGDTEKMLRLLLPSLRHWPANVTVPFCPSTARSCSRPVMRRTAMLPVCSI